MTLSLTPMQTPEPDAAAACPSRFGTPEGVKGLHRERNNLPQAKPLRHTRRDARRGDRTVALVREEFETLHSYLKALSPADWQHETACAEWDVSEVVAHLAWVAQLYTEWIARGLAGDSSTPTGAWEAGSVSGAEAAPSVAKSAQAFRASLGDTVLATFCENTAGLLDLFHGLDAQDWEKPCYHPGAIYPVSTFLSLRMMELSLHGWDIRSQLEPSARLSPESVQFIVELLPNFFSVVVQSERLLAEAGAV